MMNTLIDILLLVEKYLRQPIILCVPFLAKSPFRECAQMLGQRVVVTGIVQCERKELISALEML